MRRIRAALAVLALSGWAMLAVAASATELGIDGTSFTVDGEPTFLLGFSYYGALGASDEFIAQDLDDLAALGFNWFRVWVTWNAYENDISAVGPDGAPREPYLSRLRALIEAADERGMVVDVTVSRSADLLPDQPALVRAWETLAAELASYRNVYFDLANERNIGDGRFVGYEELREARDAIKAIDPERLVTASHAGGELSREDVEAYVAVARVDFLSPHRPRHPGSAEETEARTREYLAWARDAGHAMPVHHQEPFRRGFQDWQPTAEDFLTDLAGAVAGGAAGWCFHNGGDRAADDGRPRRSFDMRADEGRLMDQLDDEELAVVRGAATLVERAQ